MDCSDIYIGYTNDLKMCKKEHKIMYNDIKNKNYNNKLYQTMRDFGGFENWKMEIIEDIYASDKNAAIQIMQSYIDTYKPTLNTNSLVS